MFVMNLLGPLEAVLFASGDPVTAEQLMTVLDVDEDNIAELAAALEHSLEERGSGLQLHRVAGGYQLVTRPEYFSYVEKLTQITDKKLSAAAMETLSIIAFKQPVTKQEIEHIRGVRIERVLARLIELELVREMGRKAVLGRPILYGTTDTFLQCFGLNRLEDLPALPEQDEAAADAAEQLSLLPETEES
mgnify:CR=1 FL=1